MYAFLNTLETISLRFSPEGNIILFSRGINDNKTITLLNDCKFIAFNTLIETLQNHHQSKVLSDNYDPILVLTKQFECYKNNLYFFHEKIISLPDSYMMSILEFYIERFSIEMFLFLKNMPVVKMKTLKEKLTKQYLWEEKEYSELLSCKEFIVSYGL